MAYWYKHMNTHTAHRQKAKAMILLLLFALFVQSGQGQNNECILEYHEEPPPELDCKPFREDNKWDLRVSCEVREPVNNELAAHYRVRWFHKNVNNTVIELHASEIHKSGRVERTIFGETWFGRNFTDEVIGDIWCQPILTNDINVTLSKSQILTIRERNYYQNLSTCSGVKFLREASRCISVLKSSESITPTKSTATSSFITPSITRTTLSSITSAARSSIITPSHNTMTTLSCTSESIVENTQHSSIITEYMATTTTIVENCPSISTFQQESSQQEKLLVVLIAIGSCIMVLLIILIFVLIIIIIQRKRSKDIHPRTTERVRQELPLTNINNDDTIGSLHTNFEYLAATETGRAPPTITHHYSTISDNVYVQTSTDNNKVSDASQHCYSSVHTNTQNENTTTISGDSAIPTEEYNKLNHDENSRDTTLPRGMDIYSSLELSQESSYNHIERTSGPKGPHMEHQNGYSTLRKQEQS